MKITIIINNKIAEHLDFPHTFYNCCEEAEIVLKKVQEEINKQFQKKK